MPIDKCQFAAKMRKIEFCIWLVTYMGLYDNVLLDIFTFLHDLIFTPEFLDFARTDRRHFTRPGGSKLPFPAFFAFLLFGRKYSLNSKIARFLDLISSEHVFVTKQAISKRRNFIKAEALHKVLEVFTQKIYDSIKVKTFRNFLVTAIDGTRLNLPDSENIHKCFGVQKTGNAPQAQALLSCLYDALNGFVLDSQIAPCKGNERVLAEKHLDKLKEFSNHDILVTLDRGYPSGKLLRSIMEHGFHFVMRCDETFLRSIHLDGEDQIISHRFHKEKTPLTFRVTALSISDSTTEYLLSNLPMNEFSMEDLAQLYHLRWEIEIAYLHLKKYVEIENISGLNENSVKQDIFSSLFVMNVAAAMILKNQDEFNRKHNKPENKHEYKQCVALTIGEVKDNIVALLFFSSKKKRTKLLTRMLTRCTSYTTSKQPERHFEREVKHKTMKFCISRRPV